MENINDHSDLNHYKVFEKQPKMVNSISNNVFIIHGVFILKDQ